MGTDEKLSKALGALRLIQQLGGMTILGPADGEHCQREDMVRWAHEVGAAKAFAQAADIAKDALDELSASSI